jgi:hypothetical protein
MFRILAFTFLFTSLLTPALASDETVEFRAPSGNILCASYLDPETNKAKVRCDMINGANGEPLLPMPADCDAGWGNMFIVNESGKAGLECAGDLAANPTAPVLDYGLQMERYGIICSSEKSGMTCTNKDGHGFFLSRAKQRLF